MKLTYKEVLDAINRAREDEKSSEIMKAIDDVVIDALERRIPKDVIMGDVCPNCGSRGYTETGDTFLDYRLNYCDNCGQRLKWPDEEE